MALNTLWGQDDSPYAQQLSGYSYTPRYGGALPQPLTTGNDPTYQPNKRNAPVYSSAGVGTTLATPWGQTSGVIAPGVFAPDTRNPGQMDPMLAATLSAGHAGGTARGAAAFLGAGYNPWTQEMGGPEGSYSAPQNQPLSQLFNVARDLGLDTSRYSQEAGGVDIRGNRLGDANTPNAMDLYNDLNQATRDYVSVGGLSGGWTGGGPSSATRTIYKDVGGKLLPVTRPRHYTEVKDNGFIGREGLTGLMMMLPAFGGWAGLLGQGASGTLTAGGSLGLTSGLGSTIGTGLSNALVNSGMNALISRNPMGLVSGLGSSLAGAGLNSAMGGSGLSNLFNTAGSTGPLNINPMNYYNSAMRTAGLGGSPLSQGIQGLQGIRSLANLFGRS